MDEINIINANFTCDLNALNDIQRNRLGRFHRDFLPLAISIDELKNGYDLKFPYDETLFVNAAEYITIERLCCPFLRLNISLAQNGETFNISIAGDDGVKTFIKAELGF
jgi:hypothetical protein